MHPESAQPQLLCAVTGAVLPPERMLRFAEGPDGRWLPDIDGNLPGVGLWVAADAECITRACAEGKLGAGVDAAALVEQADRLLARKCLDLLGLARKSGAAVMGFEKVRTLLEGNGPVLLIQASDAAEDGKRKLKQKAAAEDVFELFPAEALSRAVGKENTVHIGVKADITTGRLAKELRRLAILRNERKITDA
ncbi:MAG: DUF448 domain-containing protein [Alphaproteobacteria bacterium]|nr:DUF448 domain-containing protein [Alphaproteobacteria bacterium]